MDSKSAAVVRQLLTIFGAGDPEARTLEDPRRRLREILTVIHPGQMPAEAWPLLAILWSHESQQRSTTKAAQLARASDSGWSAKVSIWRGDITTLEIGAIVNAANSGLTGCYQPLHACVDNAIHTAAGPWLREECGRVMLARGRPEPTGTATATGGYYLPAGHVIHTVGPIVDNGKPTAADQELLHSCYSECLRVGAALHGVDSIAFCGISTGLFGYPADQAAPLAIRTVKNFIENDARLEHVVFVAFTTADYQVYTEAFQDVLHGQQ